VRRLSSWRLAQRIILVIGLGLALAVLGRYLVTLRQSGNFGWYSYAPLNSSLSKGDTSTVVLQGHLGLRPWLRLLIWLALIGVWTSASLFLLRPAGKGITAQNPE
jgi:hypothetical protein